MVDLWSDRSPLSDELEIYGIPNFGLRVKFSHQFPDTIGPFTRPRWKHVIGLIGLSSRYIREYLRRKKQNKRIFIDTLYPTQYYPYYGVPVGGIGCGTIGRTLNGSFCRYQMIPGMYEYEIDTTNQFILTVRYNDKTIYQNTLSTKECIYDPQRKCFNSEQGIYHALYPRSWSVYQIPDLKLTLVCKQVSPVFPHNYQDTSLPVACFHWMVYNDSENTLDVSITFVFRDGQGNGTKTNGPVDSKQISAEGLFGAVIEQKFKSMDCHYGIAAASSKDVNVSVLPYFDPNSNGAVLWNKLLTKGSLGTNNESTLGKRAVAVAVCAQTTVAFHSTGEVDMALCWHMPTIKFGDATKTYSKRYTRWYSGPHAVLQLLQKALTSRSDWEREIGVWQLPVLRGDLPAWYKSALFNELYYVSDGGTVWLDGTDGGDKLEEDYGLFGYLEGHEYRMYNTYDVHFYASWALVMLWPKLQLILQNQFAQAIPKEEPKMVKFLMDGRYHMVKAANCVPHDLGDPEDEPFVVSNAYLLHPTNEWKDLNLKFVIQVYRDYILTDDLQHMSNMYVQAKNVMRHSERWDTDSDGLIENAGFADQTYDTWSASGASAYCGSLWLAALFSARELARTLNITEDVDHYTELLGRARKAYIEKLWNGVYYNYDSSSGGHHDSIQTDQLAGLWYLKACGVADNEVLPADNVKSALRAVHSYNVEPFKDMGAINGMRPDGSLDTSSIQSEEFWTGVSYAAAASMIQEGLWEEGMQTAYGVYHTCYERYGLGFQTPEAYTTWGKYRSLGYMRPLSIWAIQHAIQKYHLAKLSSPETKPNSK